MSTKELQDKLAKTMKQWQAIEEASIKSTTEVIAKTNEPLIKLVMEIIKKDSESHKAVQAFILEALEGTVVFSTDGLIEVWDAIEEHLALERRMVGYVQEALADLAGTKMVIPEYLLTYLKEDEQKHDNLLASLESLKRGMYPYA